MSLKHMQQRRFGISRIPQTDFLTATGATGFVPFIVKDRGFANYDVATSDNTDHATGVEQATEQWLLSHDTGRAFEFDVSSEMIGRLLYLLFGAVVTTTPDPATAPTVRQHVFTPMSLAVSRQGPAISLVEQLGNAMDRLLPSMVAESLGLRGDAIDRISGSAGFRGSGKYTTPSGVTLPDPLATPALPTVTNQGTPGTTSYTYYVVAKDANGRRTVPSPAGSTATGNATLTGTNFNRITWTPIAGAVSYDVLKTNTNTLLGTVAAATIDDTGQATGAYVPATTNETGAGLNYFHNSQASFEIDDAGVITNYGATKRINSWSFDAGNETLADDAYRPGAALYQTAGDPASGALRSELLWGKRTYGIGANVRLNLESEELAALKAQKPLKPKIELIGKPITGAYFHKLTIQGEKSPYRTVNLGERNGIVGLDLAMNLLYDLAAGKVLTLTLINEVASYTT